MNHVFIATLSLYQLKMSIVFLFYLYLIIDQYSILNFTLDRNT